jgi:hypothetical protein
VPALLEHPAAIEHHDLVGVLHGREAVRDDQRGAPRQQLLQRVLDQRLRLGVQRRGRLVQQQDGRVLEKRPGDGDPLLLPARQADAPFADLGLVSRRQPLDELLGAGIVRESPSITAGPVS